MTEKNAVQAKKGYYGIFGGQYVPEDVANALQQLEDAYLK